MSHFMGADAVAMGMVPWPWDPFYKSMTPHSGRRANFVFGDGHVEGLTAAEVAARNQDEWFGK